MEFVCCKFLHLVHIFFFMGPNILLGTIFLFQVPHSLSLGVSRTFPTKQKMYCKFFTKIARPLDQKRKCRHQMQKTVNITLPQSVTPYNLIDVVSHIRISTTKHVQRNVFKIVTNSFSPHIHTHLSENVQTPKILVFLFCPSSNILTIRDTVIENSGRWTKPTNQRVQRAQTDLRNGSLPVLR
jgi:hypothetical protein